MRLTAVVITLAMILPTTAPRAAEAVLLSGEKVKYLGGAHGFETSKSIKGKITVSTEKIIFSSSQGDFEIQTASVTELLSVEYSNRRIKGAILRAVILSPWSLFTLLF